MDSVPETLKHIAHVRRYLARLVEDLKVRGAVHDRSKLASPEVEILDEVTPKLAQLVYGTPEYFEQLAAMKPMLDHHYANNRHHPEHNVDGIRGMNLLDVVEMIVDWKAAGLRHADGGDLRRSIEQNQKRYGYTDELKAILLNTAPLLDD